MMCELLGMSSSVSTHISLSLHELSQHGGRTDHHADGWGLATYDNLQAQVYREAAPAAFSQKMHFLETHHQPTRCAIAHIRHATQGAVSFQNTQPFSLQIRERSHVFAHNGDFKNIRTQLTPQYIRPHGETDSETAFCYLMENLLPLLQRGIPSVEERRSLIKKIFLLFSELGPANILYSDGDLLYAFANKRKQPDGRVKPPGLFFLPRECDCNSVTLKQAGVRIGCKPNKTILFASVPLTAENWQPLPSNQLFLARNGKMLPKENNMAIT